MLVNQYLLLFLSSMVKSPGVLSLLLAKSTQETRRFAFVGAVFPETTLLLYYSTTRLLYYSTTLQETTVLVQVELETQVEQVQVRVGLQVVGKKSTRHSLQLLYYSTTLLLETSITSTSTSRSTCTSTTTTRHSGSFNIPPIGTPLGAPKKTL